MVFWLRVCRIGFLVIFIEYVSVNERIFLLKKNMIYFC